MDRLAVLQTLLRLVETGLFSATTRLLKAGPLTIPSDIAIAPPESARTTPPSRSRSDSSMKPPAQPGRLRAYAPPRRRSRTKRGVKH